MAKFVSTSDGHLFNADCIVRVTPIENLGDFGSPRYIFRVVSSHPSNAHSCIVDTLTNDKVSAEIIRNQFMNQLAT